MPKMFRLFHGVWLDDDTFSGLNEDVKLLVARDTPELQEWLDNPKLKHIDDDCPNTLWLTVPVSVLLQSFLAQHPDAFDDLMPMEDPGEREPELTDDEILKPYTNYPPEEWDVPGSSDYQLTHGHGGEDVISDDEIDDDAILDEYNTYWET